MGYGGEGASACGTQVSGYFVADRVTVAEKTIPTMSVGVATSVGWPAQFSQDGILGLSWNQYNQGISAQPTCHSCLSCHDTHRFRSTAASYIHPMFNE